MKIRRWLMKPVLSELAAFRHQLATMENTMSAKLDELIAAVAAEDEVIDSVLTLVTDLVAQVQANLTDPVALQKLIDDVTSKKDKMAAAVAANTPAAPTP